MKHKDYKSVLVVQLITILLAGIISQDMGYMIGISIIGVVFNFFVSINKPIGFLFGVIYAIANGIVAYDTQIYATFVFMIFLQAPMALYSFVSWARKKKSTESIMREMSIKQNIALGIAMATLGVMMYFVLGGSKSMSVLLDTIFFVCSVSACLLLAFCYKNAYVITLMSGLGGTFLWSYHMVETGSGCSIAVFYMIVSINSVIAVYEQYIQNRKFKIS